MNFCDTIVIVKEFDTLFNRWEIARVNFYNDRREQFLHADLSLWGGHIYSYTYDDNGRIKFKHFPGGRRERYDFDGDGKLIKSAIYDSDGKNLQSTKLIYNSKGLLAKEEIFSWVDRETENVEYQYDSNNKLVHFINDHHDISIKYDKLGYMKTLTDNYYTYEFKRDSVGLLKFIEGRDLASIRNFGGTLSDKKYEYLYYSFDDFSIKNIKETDWSIYTNIITTYDSKGNWISKLCFIDEAPQVFYERTIEYFK